MPTFFQPVELPEKCFLQEVLLSGFPSTLADCHQFKQRFRKIDDIVKDVDIEMQPRLLSKTMNARQAEFSVRSSIGSVDQQSHNGRC